MRLPTSRPSACAIAHSFFKRKVALPALDSTHVGAVDVCTIGEFLLRTSRAFYGHAEFCCLKISAVRSFSLAVNKPLFHSCDVTTWNLLAAFFLTAAIAFGDDFKTIDEKEYKNVTVSRVEPDGIVIVTSSGISKVYFTELPKEVQERFHYDPAKSAAYSAEQNAGLELLRKQRAEESQKRAEEREKYWREQAQIKSQQQAEVKRQEEAAEEQQQAEIQRIAKSTPSVSKIAKSIPSVSKEGVPEHTYELLQDYTIIMGGTTTDLRRRLRRGERYHGRILVDHAEIDINGISYSVPSGILSVPLD